MGRHCLNHHTLSTLRRILVRHFFYSSSATATATSTSTTASDSLSSLKNFLVGSLGFSEQQALSTSANLTKLRQSQGAKKVCGTNFSSGADSVVSFLEQKGLEKPQIRNLVYSVPQILTCRIDQNLEPKINFFQQLGFSVSDIVVVISNHPRILSSGLDSAIRPAVEALRVIFGNNDDVIRVIKKIRLSILYSGVKYIGCNVSLLQAQGIPIESIRACVLRTPSSFLTRPQVFKDKMAEAEEKWGVSPSSSRFLHAVHNLVCFSEKNIESKCRVFESFGWKRSDVIDLFRCMPYCFGYSGEMIKAKLSFFMNEFGYNPRHIVTKPNLITFSLKKRIIPRHLVLKLLKEAGLISKKSSVYYAINMSESQFLERFIQPFENDVPNLRNIFIDSIGSSAKEQDERGNNIHLVKLKPYSVRK